MRECGRCVFQHLDCLGEQAVFILEVLIRLKPELGSYCGIFDAARVESYRQIQEYLGAGIERPDEYKKKSLE